MYQLSVTKKREQPIEKMAWSLSEISKSTGLSEKFLRYEVRRGFLQTRKFGRRVLVLSADFQAYLERGSIGGKL